MRRGGERTTAALLISAPFTGASCPDAGEAGLGGGTFPAAWAQV